MEFHRIDDNFAAAGQITPADVPEIARQGYKVIVNNRPDNEGGPEQPNSDQVRAAAEAEGLEYHYIPMTPDALSLEMIEEFRQALENGPGPVLAHCKSGARSTALWALVQCCHNNCDPDDIIAQAYQQGYDLSQMRPLFQAYAKQACG
jgi:uncharacterized protein (TIGR01244 family)